MNFLEIFLNPCASNVNVETKECLWGGGGGGGGRCEAIIFNSATPTGIRHQEALKTSTEEILLLLELVYYYKLLNINYIKLRIIKLYMLCIYYIQCKSSNEFQLYFYQLNPRDVLPVPVTVKNGK